MKTLAFMPLTEGWSLSALDGPLPEDFSAEPIPATVPGFVHTDLLRSHLIDSPFDGANEEKQFWIGRTHWQYRNTFSWSPNNHTHHDLVASGLDTVAEIVLNGTVIAHTENQHRSYRFDVGSLLRAGENELIVTFAPPVTEIEQREKTFGSWPHVYDHPFNMLRKSACNFGWDWGIDVATSGIWKEIGIESWSHARIASVRPLSDYDGTDGFVTAHVELECDTVTSPLRLTLEVDGQRKEIALSGNKTSVTMCVRDADAWWPRGYGDATLYPLSITVHRGDDLLDRWDHHIGFRRIKLDTSPDQYGNRFELSINGQKVLVRGVNWIPDHAFVTEIGADRYARRFHDAIDANVNLLRVWGGGIYESEHFYDLADQNGILVWQDFLFACAAYPEEPWIYPEVEAEARENITRLSKHPSLVIWNGNNENTWAYVDWGWRKDLNGRAWGDGYYSTLLPQLLAELDPSRPYSPASPYSFSDYSHPNEELNGTMHIWDVWNQKDYTSYREHRPRFVSEFGFQAPPAWSTLTSVVHDEPLDPHGRQMLIHQKAEDGNLKLERGMKPHLPAVQKIEDWFWATQLNQAHAIWYGILYYRSLTPYNAGTILWQLNDNWPVISWAVVDFAEHRKPAWYALKDAYQPRLITINIPDDRAGVLEEQKSMHATVLNDTSDSFTGEMTIRRIRFTGEELASSQHSVTVHAREVVRIVVPPAVADIEDPSTELIVTEMPGFGRRIYNAADVIDQKLESENTDVSATKTSDGYDINITARSYVRDIFVHADMIDQSAHVDKGLVSLLPGESTVIHVTSDLSVDAEKFVAPSVIRSANDLRAHSSATR